MESVNVAGSDNRYNIKISTTRPINQAIDQLKIINEGINIDFANVKTEKTTACSHSIGTLVGLEPVHVADSLHQPPDQQSPDNIVNCLCDDVLYNIFEDPSFNSMQLFAIGSVCTRFNHIVMNIFKRKYKGTITLRNEIPHNAPLWLVEQYFRMFGPLISIIDTHIPTSASGLRSNVIFALVTKYCVNISRMNGVVTDCMPATFECPKLHYLDMSIAQTHCLPPVEAFFMRHSQLKAFRFCNQYSTFDIAKILRHLRNLETLTVFNGVRLDDVTYFEQMEQLETLHLIGTPMKVAVRILDTIADGNAQLKTLVLENAAKDIVADFTRWRQLTSLKSVELSHVHYDSEERILNALVGGKVQLERLKVHNIGYIDHNPLVNQICQMQSVKYLSITSINDDSLLRIIRHGQHEEIAVESFEGLTIRGIRMALQQSKHLKKVQIHFALSQGTTVDQHDLNAINALRTKFSIDIKATAITFSG